MGDCDKKKKSLLSNILSGSKGLVFGSNNSTFDLTCYIHTLDDREVTFSITNKTLGRSLLEAVCESLGVLPWASYFGLRYQDSSGLTQWINLDDRIGIRMKDLKFPTLGFRFYYYPKEPLSCFTDNNARYLFYLQLRRDLYVGRLRANPFTIYELAAYALQVDHALKEIPPGFNITSIPGGLRLLPNITVAMISRIKSRLKKVLGISRYDALKKFIELAVTIETYGMEPFQVLDQRNNGLCIGFNYKGISIFKDGQSINMFEWRSVKQITSNRKNLVIVVSGKNLQFTEEEDLELGFKCQSQAAAKAIALRALDCQNFIRSQIVMSRSNLLVQSTRPQDHSMACASDNISITGGVIPNVLDDYYKCRELKLYDEQAWSLSSDDSICAHSSQQDLINVYRSARTDADASSLRSLREDNHFRSAKYSSLEFLGHASDTDAEDVVTPTPKSFPKTSNIFVPNLNPSKMLPQNSYNASAINIHFRSARKNRDIT